MKRILAALIIAILVLPLMATPVLAASLGISPSKIDVVIPENGTVQVDFQVHYFTGDINAKVVGMPFEVSPASFNVASSPTIVTLTFTDTDPSIQSNEDYEGYVRFEGAIGTSVSLVVNIKAKVTIQMTAIVASPPEPTNGGNGGNGGGDYVPPAPTIETPTPPAIPIITEAPISVPSTDGNVTVDVPTGTTMQDADGNAIGTVTVTEMPPESMPEQPEEAEVIGLTYDFEPDGATFDPPITLTFNYTDGDIPEGANEGELVVAYYDEASGKWVEIPCVVDPTTNTITAQVAHFTAFAVIIKDEDVSAVPVPTTPVVPTKPALTPPLMPVPAPTEPEQTVTPEQPVEVTPIDHGFNWMIVVYICAAIACIGIAVLVIRRKKKESY